MQKDRVQQADGCEPPAHAVDRVVRVVKELVDDVSSQEEVDQGPVSPDSSAEFKIRRGKNAPDSKGPVRGREVRVLSSSVVRSDDTVERRSKESEEPVGDADEPRVNESRRWCQAHVKTLASWVGGAASVLITRGASRVRSP